jgi:hypothetical protein
VQPRKAYAVAFFYSVGVATGFHYHAHAFVSGNEGETWFYWPVAINCVQIGVANSAGVQSYQKLARPRIAESDFLNAEGFPAFACHRA